MREYFKNRIRQLNEIDNLEASLKITLVLFVFSNWVTGDRWEYFTPVLILAALALVLPGFYKSKYLWYSVAFVFILKTISEWWFQDNHLFVNTYWAISIAFALSFKDVKKVLAANARVMIGLIFLFAIVWKFLSPDFISGSYFHFTFLTDIRFIEEATLFGDVSRSEIGSNIIKLNEFENASIEQVTLTSSSRIKGLTRLVTWHTVVIELLLAILFLLPARLRLSRYRNYFLVGFVLTTYLAMPIHSFAWLIIAIGISQVRDDEWPDKAILIACLPVTLIYQYVPFMQWLSDYFNK
jgi:hypothetical protein